jgi:hypothetical protein
MLWRWTTLALCSSFASRYDQVPSPCSLTRHPRQQVMAATAFGQACMDMKFSRCSIETSGPDLEILNRRRTTESIGVESLAQVREASRPGSYIEVEARPGPDRRNLRDASWATYRSLKEKISHIRSESRILWSKGTKQPAVRTGRSPRQNRAPFYLFAGRIKPQVSPLRFAPVETTKLSSSHLPSLGATTLSSRPERTRISHFAMLARTTCAALRKVDHRLCRPTGGRNGDRGSETAGPSTSVGMTILLLGWSVSRFMCCGYHRIVIPTVVENLRFPLPLTIPTLGAQPARDAWEPP